MADARRAAGAAMAEYQRLVATEGADERDAYLHVVRDFHEAIFVGYDLPKVVKSQELFFFPSLSMHTFSSEETSTSPWRVLAAPLSC